MIDFNKFVKFSKPGPRYTSYPTALEFIDTFSYDEYTSRLKNGTKPLSLYFHLPFCRSACYFCGCNVTYTTNEQKMARYLDYLERELDLLSQILNTKREVVQMHFGGGTPTYYNAKSLERVFKAIRARFSNFAKDAEISCEIDPRFFNREQMSVFRANGLNRISFGVQDFDEKVQREIHRIQPFEITQNAVQIARDGGIKSINTDLIYGLPYQSPKSFANTLKTALSLSPDRFAIFNYAHVPWLKKSMRKFDESTLPNPASKLEILKYTIEFLPNNGYKMIGMDHYARPDDELFGALKNGTLHRNFQGYTTKGGADLIGIGLTSIGEGDDYYAQNFKDLPSYENAIDSGRLPNAKGVLLSAEDRLRKAVIMSLMANFNLDINAIENAFNVDFFRHFSAELELLKINFGEFVELSGDKISVNETGILLIRNIAMCFDEYMVRHSNNAQSFSKTL